jgi:hypothetical protein
MKKIFNIIAIILISASMTISCDKIPQDEYTVFSGAAGEWYDGNGVSDHSQRAIIEKYTGVRCVNCPNADVTITAATAQYGDKLIALAIHDSSNFTRPIGDTPRLSSEDGNTWSNFFGVLAAGEYPTALINRTLNGSAWDLFTPTSGINSRVDNIINQTPKVAIQTDAANNNGSVTINVNLEFLQTVSEPLTLTLLIMEDGIIATQKYPDHEDENYVHNHVLRDVITDVWGADIDCTGASGEKRVALFNYTPASSEWNLANCHIVAMVSKKDSREILNVAECHID